MSKMSYAQRIKARAAELEAELAVLAQQMESTRKERDELLIAEKVLARLGPEDTPEVTGDRRKEPTVGDQIVSFLYRHGPMRSNELLSAMQTDWRSDLTFETLSSTLSRVKAQGRVYLDPETKFWSATMSAEQHEKGPDSTAAEPSQLNGAAGSYPEAPTPPT